MDLSVTILYNMGYIIPAIISMPQVRGIKSREFRSKEQIAHVFKKAGYLPNAEQEGDFFRIVERTEKVLRNLGLKLKVVNGELILQDGNSKKSNSRLVFTMDENFEKCKFEFTSIFDRANEIDKVVIDVSSSTDAVFCEPGLSIFCKDEGKLEKTLSVVRFEFYSERGRFWMTLSDAKVTSRSSTNIADLTRLPEDKMQVNLLAVISRLKKKDGITAGSTIPEIGRIIRDL